jgi:hypothetical protein
MTKKSTLSIVLLSLSIVGSVSSSGLAQAPATPPPAPPPAPYSLPWQLRPAAAATVLRSDTAFAFYESPMSGKSGTTIASMLLGSFKVTPEFAPLLRLGMVYNSPPEGPMSPGSKAVLLNPVIGGTYVFKLTPELRLAAFLGLAIPVGGGGGDSPDPASALARTAGIPARSALDNAMFAVNDMTIFPGVSLAYVAHGFTAQLELTLLQLTRVRGDAVQKDESRTNFTSGVHLGYFFIPQLSAGAELRYQRWLSTPVAVEMDPTGTLRDTLSMAVGLGAHFKLSDTIWMRPGLAYARGLDDPMGAAKYNIIQLDVPVQF